MDDFEARVRGARAAQILNDDIYKNAVKNTQAQLVNELINIDPFDPEAPIMTLRGVMRIQALFFVMHELTSVMTTGEVATEGNA
jgi:hypothetical protein